MVKLQLDVTWRYLMFPSITTIQFTSVGFQLLENEKKRFPALEKSWNFVILENWETCEQFKFIGWVMQYCNKITNMFRFQGFRESA